MDVLLYVLGGDLLLFYEFLLKEGELFFGLLSKGELSSTNESIFIIHSYIHTYINSLEGSFQEKHSLQTELSIYLVSNRRGENRSALLLSPKFLQILPYNFHKYRIGVHFSQVALQHQDLEALFLSSNKIIGLISRGHSTYYCRHSFHQTHTYHFQK